MSPLQVEKPLSRQVKLACATLKIEIESASRSFEALVFARGIQ